MSKDRSNQASLPLLRDMRILVTGAASGIGRAAASFFASAGARVVVCDLDADALAQDTAHWVYAGALAIDVTDERQCVDGVGRGGRPPWRSGRSLQQLGISDIVAPAVDLDIGDWQRIVDVSLRGSFLVARTAARHMIERKRGSIVLVSSVNGVTGIPRRHAYGPAKAAVAQLARTLACEWGSANVRVNTFAIA